MTILYNSCTYQLFVPSPSSLQVACLEATEEFTLGISVCRLS